VQNVQDAEPSHFLLKADGSKGDLLMLPAGGSRFPASKETIATGMHHVQMRGHDVFKEAVERMTEVSVELLQRAGMTNAQGEVDPRRINLVIPHQANQRIMDMVGRRLGIPKDKLFSNIEEYGNTSAASILIAMYDAYHQGRIHKDDTLLLVSFGGGFTYAAGIIQWHLEAPRLGFREKIAQRLRR